ncbi:MAG: radical SAM protein [Deltaproteobacteria bacterium]|nr:radical SAM protein [Deltaproteobacteria bacterium]
MAVAGNRPGTSRAVVLLPPLLLSRHFVDYPWLTHLGAYQAAAVLLRRGWRVEVLDGFARPRAALVRRGERAWLGEPARDFLARLRGIRADLAVVAGSPFLTVSPGRDWLGRLAAAVPASAGVLAYADMVVGGMHYAEYDGEELLARTGRLDLVLRYECEPLLDRVAAAIEGGETPPRGVLENRVAFPLDDLPLPAWERMDVPAAFGFLRRVLGTRWRPGPFPPDPAETLPIVTARGCPHGCVFCSKNPGLPEPRRQYRAVPWARLEQAIDGWVRSMGVRRLVVLDEVANLREERFEALLGLAERRGLRLEFPNGLRADRLREAHVRRLRPLASALKVSLESASRRVQRRVIGKNLDPAAVERVAAWCAAEKLPLFVHGIIGIPGERRSEIVRTVRTLAGLHRRHGAVPLLQFATPIPGTAMARRCPPAAGATADFHEAFQHGGVTTSEFDPAFLRQAADVLALHVATARERKVIVNLTYRCNNHCVFCAVGDRPARDARTADVVEALRRHRDRGFDLLDIDGGEPTLDPELPAVVSAARAMGYRRITVATNGRLLSYPWFADALVRAGVMEVLVSLHAPEAPLQERLTRTAGSFEQTVAGIRNVLAAGGGAVDVGVNTTVVRDNVAALPAMAGFLAGLGVAHWTVQVVTPFGRARAAHVPSARALRENLSAVLDRAPAGMRIQVINCPPCLLPGHESAALTDFGKAERAMVFVGESGVNLQAWLAGKRRRDARCRDCVHAVLCPGFYRFEGERRAGRRGTTGNRRPATGNGR